MRGLLVRVARALDRGAATCHDRGMRAPCAVSFCARFVPLLVAACAVAPHRDWGEVLARIAADHPGKIMAIAYRDLASDDGASHNGDLVMHAASTMKVPVMLELFARQERGELELGASVRLRNEFASIIDGSRYTLRSDDDSDADLYALVDSEVSVRDLLWRMIVRSSNLATNTLIALAEPAQITQRCKVLGARNTLVLRGVEDGKAFAAGRNNVTTADDLAALMVAIARDEAGSAANCAAMREILFAQEDRELIPAGLPPGTRIAHKTGQITGHRHDMAIVYPAEGPGYVLVILTRGFEDPDRAAEAIAEAARRVHRARG